MRGSLHRFATLCWQILIFFLPVRGSMLEAIKFCACCGKERAFFKTTSEYTPKEIRFCVPSQ
nr:hypothetical protein [Gilliamella apis]